MTTDKMLKTKTGPIGQLTFNNPERHNAVSLEMWEAALSILTEFAEDDDVRVVVVTGAGGKAFVSGADISKFESERASKEAVAHYNSVSGASMASLAQLHKPTIAMINGYCIGGGLAVAISCDIRICSEKSQFGIPAARLGLGYVFDGLRKLVGIVGPAFAKEIMFSAGRFDSGRALAIGLVNRVVSEDDLDETVTSLAETIARQCATHGHRGKTCHRRNPEGRGRPRHGDVPQRRSGPASTVKTMSKAAPRSWRNANQSLPDASRPRPRRSSGRWRRGHRRRRRSP